MSRQRVASSRFRSHETLVYRTSAHLRRAANGVLGAILLLALAAFAALTIWPSHAGTFRLSSVVADIRRDNLQRYTPIVMVAAAVLAAACLAYSTRKARRWRLERQLNRVSASVSTTDPSMVDPTTEHRVVATGLRAPRIQWVGGARRQEPPLRPLTPTTNIIGGPRMEITYLRLFNNEHRHVSFVKGAWREFGSVRMLRSAVSMTEAEARRARRDGMESLFVTTREQLESALAAVGSTPSFRAHIVDAGPTRVRVRDKYGAYPMCSILCANATWRAAVNRLLDTADLVVLDLSGYMPRHAGTRYELQRVFDRVPAERLILLADPVSKNAILEQAITDAWFGMGVGSPNAARPEVPVWLARVDKLVKRADPEHQTTRVELVTSRKETRLLLTAVQQRLHDARPIAPESRSRQQQTTSDATTGDFDPWQHYGSTDAQHSPAGNVEDAGAPGSSTAPSHDHATMPASEDVSPVSGRRRRRALAAAALVLGLVVAAAAFVWLADRDERSAEPLDIASCDQYVVQLGALPEESDAVGRIADVREMLDDADVPFEFEFGLLHDAPCGFGDGHPELYYAVAGPFGNADEAEHACRTVRAAESEHADEFDWARRDVELAGYLPVDGTFTRCR